MEKLFSYEDNTCNYLIPLDNFGSTTNINLEAVRTEHHESLRHELDRVANIFSEYYSSSDPVVAIPIKSNNNFWDNYIIVFTYLGSRPTLSILTRTQFKLTFGQNL